MTSEHDDDLSRRLAALKAPGVNVNSSPSTSTMPLSTNEDLTTRFESFLSNSPGARAASHLPAQEPTPHNLEDDKSIAELAAEAVERDDGWKLTAADEDAIDDLLAEAAVIPVDVDGKTTTNTTENYDVPEWLRGNTFDDVKVDDDEAVAVLQRIKDELALEAPHGVENKPGKEQTNAEAEEEEEDPDISGLLSRFQALDGGLALPAPPKDEPGSAKKPTYKVAPVVEEDIDETDTWCCICNEDAEYRCSGCDGDIYCSECLFEAHTGPGAGLEERRHKWTKYIKPRRVIPAC